MTAIAYTPETKAPVIPLDPPSSFRRFTDDDYNKIAQAILKERDEREEEYQRIYIDDVLPGVDIIVNRTVHGYWTAGGSYDYGTKEQIWQIASEEYHVDEFECFNAAGDEIRNNFDHWILESILNK